MQRRETMKLASLGAIALCAVSLSSCNDEDEEERGPLLESETTTEIELGVGTTPPVGDRGGSGIMGTITISRSVKKKYAQPGEGSGPSEYIEPGSGGSINNVLHPSNVDPTFLSFDVDTSHNIYAGNYGTIEVRSYSPKGRLWSMRTYNVVRRGGEYVLDDPTDFQDWHLSIPQDVIVDKVQVTFRVRASMSAGMKQATIKTKYAGIVLDSDSDFKADDCNRTLGGMQPTVPTICFE